VGALCPRRAAGVCRYKVDVEHIVRVEHVVDIVSLSKCNDKQNVPCPRCVEATWVSVEVWRVVGGRR
jgi:hypothetical protein